MSSKMENYSVGDVVYILSDTKQAIIPAMVIEATVVDTLDGKKRSWKFAAGPEGRKKILNSEEMKSEIFSSLEELEKLLQQRFSKLITDTINQAKKYENTWYGQTLKNRNVQKTSLPVEKIQSVPNVVPADPTDSLLEELGGEPSEDVFRDKFKQITQQEQQEDIRSKLRQQIGPSEDELRQSVKFEEGDFSVETSVPQKESPHVKMITMPDGNKVPVDMGV